MIPGFLSRRVLASTTRGWSVSMGTKTPLAENCSQILGVERELLLELVLGAISPPSVPLRLAPPVAPLPVLTLGRRITSVELEPALFSGEMLLPDDE